jgi:hypothetical protein
MPQLSMGEPASSDDRQSNRRDLIHAIIAFAAHARPDSGAGRVSKHYAVCIFGNVQRDKRSIGMPSNTSRTHPHTGATYRIFNFDNGMFGVEVNIPDMLPARVGNFATQAAATAWVGSHRDRVQIQIDTGRWFGQRVGRAPAAQRVQPANRPLDRLKP